MYPLLEKSCYCRFHITFQSAVPKFVVNLPITFPNLEVGRELRNEVRNFGAKFTSVVSYSINTNELDESSFYLFEFKILAIFTLDMNLFSRQGKALPNKVREEIVQKYLDNYSVTVIAAGLNLPYKTVSNIIDVGCPNQQSSLNAEATHFEQRVQMML